MQNYHALETEAAYRRSEWERTIATATQVAQTRLDDGWTRWSRLPQLALAHLRSFSVPRLVLRPFGNTDAGGRRAPRPMEGGRATVT